MLDEAVRIAAQRHGDAIAFVAADGWTVTHADLDRLSDEVAAGLAKDGIEPGHVVALLLPSTPDYVVAYLAAAKVGAITAGVNPRYMPDERRRALDVVRPDLVIASPALVVEMPARVTIVEAAERVEDILSPLRHGGEAPPPLDSDPSRPVAIVLTSGTTGTPKGAVFTGKQLAAVARIDGGDVRGGNRPLLGSTEFPHVGVMTKLAWYLTSGARMHLMRRWRAADALRIVAEQRIPSVGGISTQIALMLRDPSFDDYDFSCVRSVVAGGGPVSPAIAREARERFGAPFSIRYSSTESGGVGCATAFDADDDEALYTVGRPRAGIEVAVRHESRAPLPAGEVGDVWLRSDAVMAGYWRDPETTAETLVDGWVRMGDLGSLDERGCVHLAGRSKEMFVRGGYNVYPAEVEAVLAAHPLVAAVAVAPRPDPVMGEIGVAVVVPADPSQPPALDDLRRFASERLAAYKLPEAIRIADALPLTAVDKIDRRALAARETAGDDEW